VGEGDAGDVYDLTAQEFDDQLALLRSFGVSFATLDQLFDAREGKSTLRDKTVVLTFDDGRQCLYTVAAPILRKYNAVAENFVVSSYLGDDESTRKRINGHPYLLQSEVEEMYRTGVMIPESHSRTHRAERTLSKMQQQGEIKGSRNILRRKLGAPINFFAYPYGSFAPVSRQLAEEAGYRGALSVGRSTGTSYDLHRVSLRRDSTPLLRTTLEHAFGK
jgi:peptidoglycan/xylan/chitin deacetylase (PgdA/CDA1 family)